MGSDRAPFECNCKNGYIRAEYGDCIDVDECVDSSLCPAGYNCANTVGMTHTYSRKLLQLFHFRKLLLRM